MIGMLRSGWGRGCAAALGCLALVALASPSRAAPSLLVDAATGDILAGEEATRSWHPASLTKLMTAHLALLAVDQGRLALDAPVVISARAAAQPPSRLGLPVGHALRLEDALRVMMVRSANDLAVAVAEAVGGSEGDFVIAMNAEAERLGMSGTRFTNASGLPDERQVSNARDLALLAMAIQRYHQDRYDLFRTPFVTVNGKTLKNTNALLGRYPGMDGMKTGYICASGFNLVASATRDGRRLISVVLGASDVNDRSEQASALLDRGFAGLPPISNIRDAKADAPVGVVDVRTRRCARGGTDERDEAPAVASTARSHPSKKRIAAVPPVRPEAPSRVKGEEKPVIETRFPTRAVSRF